MFVLPIVPADWEPLRSRGATELVRVSAANRIDKITVPDQRLVRLCPWVSIHTLMSAWLQPFVTFKKIPLLLWLSSSLAFEQLPHNQVSCTPLMLNRFLQSLFFCFVACLHVGKFLSRGVLSLHVGVLLQLLLSSVVCCIAGVRFIRWIAIVKVSPGVSTRLEPFLLYLRSTCHHLVHRSGSLAGDRCIRWMWGWCCIWSPGIAVAAAALFIFVLIALDKYRYKNKAMRTEATVHSNSTYCRGHSSTSLARRATSSLVAPQHRGQEVKDAAWCPHEDTKNISPEQSTQHDGAYETL